VIKHRKLARRMRGATSVAIVVTFALLIVGRRHALSSALTRLGHSHWTWIPLAIGLESASMVTFALMQRRLLRAGGRHVGKRPMMATVFAANALSVSVPMAGPEIGAAFIYRRLRGQGADTALASWCLLAGGLVSWIAAIVVLAAGGVLSDNILVAGVALLAGLLAVGAGVVVHKMLGRTRSSSRLERPIGWLVGHLNRMRSEPVEEPTEALRGWLYGLRSLRLTPVEWGRVGLLGLTNWVADAGVLAMSILAIGAPVPWRTLLLVYGLATVVGSLGITPGGIGLVEGTLCLGLVSTGIPAALALAAVLLYRLVSFWLVMAAGWIVLLRLRLTRSSGHVAMEGSLAA
jgi:uncharacterized protein (TIRG00374 family)